MSQAGDKNGKANPNKCQLLISLSSLLGSKELLNFESLLAKK